MRPFRFLADPSEVVNGKALAATARRAEAMGYSALMIPDHLVDILAPVPALATIAAVTERIRIGTFVFNNDLRHPAVLAHDLASLDVLSDGRLEIGIGAGWNVPEYEAIGLPFDRTPVRVERMKEGVAVLKGCFAEGPFSFSGTSYTIGEYDFLPKPVQKPHPPFLIGGGGRRTLTFAAREANTIGLAPRILANGRGDPRSITVAATAEKIEWVREAAGDRFDDLEFNIYPSMSEVTVTDHARDEARKLIDRMRDRTGYELTEDELLEAPHIFIGTIDFLVDKFVRLRKQLGISSILLGAVDELAAVVERLAGT
ncbi:MAG TPA: TIGR03621 family F420-dependent LLM class oxidoreductase [Candidatus Acidoferrum sp.]|nr:TIGR03621 family F420-dependent LLM class oxidoreductase [Candidatus Acidoferrum sp.]